ncbi:zinc finger protein 250-like [Homarus americanus]|nr:zinc finger protein 250-like [Homarus americanus]
MPPLNHWITHPLISNNMRPLLTHRQVATLQANSTTLLPCQATPSFGTSSRRPPRRKLKREVCSQCNKQFESRCKLKEHMFSHTGERPYQCEVCGMRFARKFCHKRHLNVHTEEKPHLCHMCGRGFRAEYDMKMHVMGKVCLKKLPKRDGPSPAKHSVP